MLLAMKRPSDRSIFPFKCVLSFQMKIGKNDCEKSTAIEGLISVGLRRWHQDLHSPLIAQHRPSLAAFKSILFRLCKFLRSKSNKLDACTANGVGRSPKHGNSTCSIFLMARLNSAKWNIICAYIDTKLSYRCYSCVVAATYETNKV